MAGTNLQTHFDQSDIPAVLADVQARRTQIVNHTASTLAIAAGTHHDRTITLNRAAGCTVTLPAATGSGLRVRLVVGTTLTSGSLVVQVTNTDIMQGIINHLSDDSAAVKGWGTAADSDTITFNRTTTGLGAKGDWIEAEDVASGLWQVTGQAKASGTEATPFSAAVPA